MGNIGRMVAWNIEQPGASPAEPDGFIDALTGGGDSRLVIDRLSGVNKYLCPPVPAPDLVCVSSCTASPIAPAAFWHCAETFVRLNSAASPGDEWAGLHRQIETRLLACFGATGLAHAILCPSGTDALLTATMLLAGERPGSGIAAILPQASETGSGVPRGRAAVQADEGFRTSPERGRRDRRGGAGRHAHEVRRRYWRAQVFVDPAQPADDQTAVAATGQRIDETIRSGGRRARLFDVPGRQTPDVAHTMPPLSPANCPPTGRR